MWKQILKVVVIVVAEQTLRTLADRLKQQPSI